MTTSAIDCVSPVRANSNRLRAEARAVARKRGEQKPAARQGLLQAYVGRPELLIIGAFLAANMVASLVMFRYPMLATLHGLAALVLGVCLAFSGKKLERVAYVAAYIAGSEVLWRMSRSGLFWEFGKYAMSAVCIVAIWRRGREKVPILPVVYLALLIPSAGLTAMNEGLDRARQLISFNLSGPLALMASAWFFSYLKLSKAQLQRVFLALIGPIMGIGAITLFGTITAADLKFTDESNFATSGGFGPNQVSAALGLGVLVALFHVLDSKASWKSRTVMLGVMIFLAAQSAMTFSRGGLYTAAGGAVLASFYLIKDPRSRYKLIFAVAIIFLLGQFVVFPKLDAFTDGALSDRFENLNASHRGEIALEELQVWQENPFMGVGPGQAHPGMAAHTEFSRLVAEHGIFGLIAIILLLVMGAKNLMRTSTNKNKAVAASMMGWGLLYMLDKAMRLAAPAFTIGLSFALLLPEEEDNPSTQKVAKKLHANPRSVNLRRLERMNGPMRTRTSAIMVRPQNRNKPISNIKTVTR